MTNRLLDLLREADLRSLLSAAEPRDLPHGSVIELPGELVRHACFLEAGFASILVDVEHRTMEVGLVGREGMLGLPAVLGSDISAYRAVVRENARVRQIHVDVLRDLMRDSSVLRGILLRYMQAGVAQITYTSFANASLTIPQRLARWVLMAHDRVDGDEIRITHTVLSDALCVQRPGVTLALHELEGRGVIRSTRGTLKVLDRHRLIQGAAGLYGPAERAYQMLLGASISSKTGHDGASVSRRRLSQGSNVSASA